MDVTFFPPRKRRVPSSERRSGITSPNDGNPIPALKGGLSAVKELVILSVAIFIVLCFVLVESTEIFLILLLICLLASLEIAGVFIPKEAKGILKSLVYILILIFIFIVVKKALEVLK